jgi:integrase
MLVVLNMILRYAVRRGYMSSSDMDIKFPKPKARQKLEVLEMKDQRRFIKYLCDNFSYMNLGIYICLCTGLRIGEVCALVWDDIDVERGLICVSKTLQRIYVVDGEKKYTEVVIDTPKSISSIREIPISQDLMKVLSPLKKAVAGNYYVLTNSPSPIEPRAYRNYYNRLLKQLDLPHLRFHGLRHTFASILIDNEVDIRSVQSALGHSNPNTTEIIYVHRTKRNLKECRDLNPLFK